MYGAAFGWGRVTATLIGVCAASAATGFGLVVAVGAVLGIMVTWAMTGGQILLVITASGYLSRINGFRDETYSVWSLTVYIGVTLP